MNKIVSSNTIFLYFIWCERMLKGVECPQMSPNFFIWDIIKNGNFHGPVPMVLQLEARSIGRSPECLLIVVGQVKGEGLCQSPMETGGQNSVPGASSESDYSSGSASNPLAWKCRWTFLRYSIIEMS